MNKISRAELKMTTERLGAIKFFFDVNKPHFTCPLLDNAPKYISKCKQNEKNYQRKSKTRNVGNKTKLKRVKRINN